MNKNKEKIQTPIKSWDEYKADMVKEDEKRNKYTLMGYVGNVLVRLMSFLAGWVLMMLVLASGSELTGYIIENGLPMTFWEYSREGMHLFFMVLWTYWTVEILKWGYKYGK